MFIPCGGEKLPARLCVRVLAARNLPVMDKSNDTTDAFVEVHFGSQMFKTEICSKSLSPIWNSEEFVFETDEQQIFDNPVQFRIMDYDTYSANDAIGRIFFDASIMVAKIRRLSMEGDLLRFTAWLPIYDTICGIRGDVNVELCLKLLVSSETANYVQILSATSVPAQMHTLSIVGLVGDLQTAPDPDYEWIDRIRTPRASNEARQQLIRRSLRDLAKNLALKAFSLGANAIFGYKEFADIEGDSSELICFRAFGTALRVSEKEGEANGIDRIAHPVVSLTALPSELVRASAAVLCVRAVHLLEDDDEAAEIRKRWWKELKTELFRQATSLGCNLVAGYSEQVTLKRRVALLSCTGTAVLTTLPGEKPSSSPCALFHVPYTDNKMPFPVVLRNCNVCKEGRCPDVLMSNCSVPPAASLIGQRYQLQVSLVRGLSVTESDDQLALEISRMLPFIEHELQNELIAEARMMNAQCNSLFELRTAMVIGEGKLVAIAAGALCRVRALVVDEGIAPPVSGLSLSSLQRVADARRFSWGSMRDAVRFRGAQTLASPSLHLRILHLRNQQLESSGSGQRQRRRVERLVDRFRKKTALDRDHFARALFERELSLKMGVVAESTSSVLAATGVAGVHVVSSSTSFALTRDTSLPNMLVFGRYTGVFIREETGAVKDVSGVDGLVSMGLNEGLCVARVHVAAMGACGLSAVRLSSTHLSASRDQTHIVFLFTADISLPLRD